MPRIDCVSSGGLGTREKERAVESHRRGGVGNCGKGAGQCSLLSPAERPRQPPCDGSGQITASAFPSPPFQSQLQPSPIACASTHPVFLHSKTSPLPPLLSLLSSPALPAAGVVPLCRQDGQIQESGREARKRPELVSPPNFRVRQLGGCFPRHRQSSKLLNQAPPNPLNRAALKSYRAGG